MADLCSISTFKYYRDILLLSTVFVALPVVFANLFASENNDCPRISSHYPPWNESISIDEYCKSAKIKRSMHIDIDNDVQVELVLIPAGRFVMGSPTDEVGHADTEEPQHEVMITTPYYMSTTEITQICYEKIMRINPSKFVLADNPVNSVMWDDAKEFCKSLGSKYKLNVRLPSEAEWEYACRAGSKTPYHAGIDKYKTQPLTDDQKMNMDILLSNLNNTDHTIREKSTRELILLGRNILPHLDKLHTDDNEILSRIQAIKSALMPMAVLGSIAWYNINSKNTTNRVGQKMPNLFGLYDMHGNVSEWVEDDWHNNYIGAPTDSKAWIDNPRHIGRVLRGGNGDSPALYLRSSARFGLNRLNKSPFLGFRIIVEIGSSPYSGSTPCGDAGRKEPKRIDDAPAK